MYTYHKGFKIRLYPTEEQEKMFWKHIHTCRALWNIMLYQNNDMLEIFHKRMNYYEMCRVITIMKLDDEFKWLGDVSLHSLQRVCDNLDDAFQNFYKNPKAFGYPKFKSRKNSKNSFPVSSYKKETYFISNNRIKIAKCGIVRCKIDYRNELTKSFLNRAKTLMNPQIYKTSNGKWILSFSIEYESQVFDNRNYSLGIDMGILEAATYSYRDLEGKVHTEVVENLNKSEKIKELDLKINKLQNDISRKYRTAQRLDLDFRSSKRYQKTLARLRKLYFHRTNVINDYYHKVSSHIVYDIRPSYIVMEDLNIRGLMKNHNLSRSILYVSWYNFGRMLHYKADRVCIPVCRVPRLFPSSQICSNCGCMKKLSLKDRVYICHECGLVIDRDVNASINLMNYTQSL